MAFDIKRSGNFMMTVDTLIGADLAGLDLRCADFQNQIMTGCNLRGSDLRGAMFMRAVLDGSDMRDCQLSQNFYRASLRGVLLDGSTVHWNSAEVVSAILAEAADTPARAAYAVAGLTVRKCWEDLVAENHSEAGWAVATLAPYVNVHPDWKAPQVMLDAAASLTR